MFQRFHPTNGRHRNKSCGWIYPYELSRCKCMLTWLLYRLDTPLCKYRFHQQFGRHHRWLKYIRRSCMYGRLGNNKKLRFGLWCFRHKYTRLTYRIRFTGNTPLKHIAVNRLFAVGAVVIASLATNNAVIITFGGFIIGVIKTSLPLCSETTSKHPRMFLDKTYPYTM